MNEARNLKGIAEVSYPRTYDEIIAHCVYEAARGKLSCVLHRTKPFPNDVYERLEKEGFAINHLCSTFVPHIYEICWAL